MPLLSGSGPACPHAYGGQPTFLPPLSPSCCRPPAAIVPSAFPPLLPTSYLTNTHVKILLLLDDEAAVKDELVLRVRGAAAKQQTSSVWGIHPSLKRGETVEGVRGTVGSACTQGGVEEGEEVKGR